MAQLQPLRLLCVVIDWWELNMQHVTMECGMIYLSALVHVSLPSILIHVVAVVMITTHIAPCPRVKQGQFTTEKVEFPIAENVHKLYIIELNFM